MKYNDNGEYKDIYVKAFDTLPVGTEVDYDGSTVPSGWTAIESYSTNEIKTGENWIDGKPLYRKVINIGNLPNTGTKNVALNITNLSQIINMYGYAIANDFTLPLPYISTSAEYQVGIQVAGNNLQIVTGFDRSAFAGYVVVEYTKTTD